MRLLLLSLLLLTQVSGFSQNRSLDMKQLQRDCIRRSSLYYFPALLKRYEQFDTSMSVQELQYLYWGQTFYPDYTSPNLFPREKFNRLLDSQQCRQAFQLCDSFLRKHPLDLMSSQYLIMAYQECDSNKVMAQKLLKRQQALVKAIVLTGDARFKKNALPAASIPDEFFFIYFYYGAKSLKQMQALEGYDVLTIMPLEGDNEQRLWFDRALINNQ